MKDMYHLQSGTLRNFDPEGYMHYLRVIRMERKAYFHEIFYEEDVVRNCPNIGKALERRKKWNILLRLENERKMWDPNFKGFY